jgi:hypothetical protein
MKKNHQIIFVKNQFNIFSRRRIYEDIFSEKDEDFDVYTRVIDKKSKFFVARIDRKDSRRRF